MKMRLIHEKIYAKNLVCTVSCIYDAINFYDLCGSTLQWYRTDAENIHTFEFKIDNDK